MVFSPWFGGLSTADFGGQLGERTEDDGMEETGTLVGGWIVVGLG